MEGTTSVATSVTTITQARMGTGMSTAMKIRVSASIIILIVGTVGNVLSFLVMRRRKLRDSSTSVYLCVLAVGDTLTIYSGLLPVVLYAFHGLNITALNPWACRFNIFIIFTTSDIAIWTLLVVTVDRFIAVWFPLKAKALCTPKRAMIAVGLVCALGFAKNFHLFWTRGTQIKEVNGEITVNHCGFPTSEYENFESYIRPWIAFTLYAFIPMAAVFVFNVLILVKLRMISKKRKAMTGKQQTTQNEAGKTNSATTLMLLSISFAFLILIIPSISVIISRPYWVFTAEDEERFALVSACVDSLAYCNHAFNFFFYCISAKKFRHELTCLLSCCCYKNRVGIAQSSVVQNISIGA